jgi:hypothetical protein
MFRSSTQPRISRPLTVACFIFYFYKCKEAKAVLACKSTLKLNVFLFSKYF